MLEVVLKEKKTLRKFPNQTVNQFEFQIGLSAAQQAMNLVFEVKTQVDPRRRVIVAFLKVEKAYDTVWRKRALYKLLFCGHRVAAEDWKIVYYKFA